MRRTYEAIQSGTGQKKKSMVREGRKTRGLGKRETRGKKKRRNLRRRKKMRKLGVRGRKRDGCRRVKS